MTAWSWRWTLLTPRRFSVRPYDGRVFDSMLEVSFGATTTKPAAIRSTSVELESQTTAIAFVVVGPPDEWMLYRIGFSIGLDSAMRCTSVLRVSENETRSLTFADTPGNVLDIARTVAEERLCGARRNIAGNDSSTA